MQSIAIMMVAVLGISDEYRWPTYYQWPEYKLGPIRHREFPPTELQPTPTTKPAKVAAKPVVWGYFSPSYCPPCERAKFDASAGLFPFELRQGTPPAGFVVESYPVFHWNDAQGQGRRWPRPGHTDDANYPGPEELKLIWNATMKPRSETVNQ